MAKSCAARCGQDAVSVYRMQHKAGGPSEFISVCPQHKELLLAGVMVDLGVIRVTLVEEDDGPRLRVEDGRLIREENSQ